MTEFFLKNPEGCILHETFQKVVFFIMEFFLKNPEGCILCDGYFLQENSRRLYCS
jgi:hypothetical protein